MDQAYRYEGQETETMKEYQRRNTKYILPGNLYMQTVYLIRDYHRMAEEAEAILEESPAPPDGQPRGTARPNQVEQKAMRREKYLSIIGIIQEAKLAIPKEYRTGVWMNIMYAEPFPEDAGRATYGRYKSQFVYEVAKKVYFLDEVETPGEK